MNTGFNSWKNSIYILLKKKVRMESSFNDGASFRTSTTPQCNPVASEESPNGDFGFFPSTR